MKSIIQTDKRCYLCGSTVVEDHHVYFGSLRSVSERNGLKVFLCPYHHRDQKHGAHGNREVDLFLKREVQKAFEEKYGHNRFMELIGRNYL
jgi:hypothetical protein